MDSFKNVLARGLDADDGDNTNIINLLIVVLSLVFFGLILFGLLILIRRMRRRQRMRASSLPRYEDVKRGGNHRQLTIQTKNGTKLGHSSVIYFKDGEPMLANPRSPPHSPDNVPEIHITFPDEQDESGRPKSGRVVVVRVGETSVGLEPLDDEQLPAYEKESNTQFYAINMDHIGGLKEKDRSYSS
jgi:hypothetical protein